MNNPNHDQNGDRLTRFLWIGLFVLLIGLLFARMIYPEMLWLSVVLTTALIGNLVALIFQNQKALKTRTAAYGINSLVTVLLVIGIVGVLDFITSRYPKTLDLTKNKVHTLSDQTDKLIKGLKQPLHATFFAKLQQREQHRPLFERYKALNPKFEIEYLDPDLEPTRVRQAGITKYGVLLLAYGARTAKVEEINEEKLTNAIIKITKERTPTVCAITGHGERNFQSQEAEGYEAVRRGLVEQSYEIKIVNILQEQKIPESCDSIAIIGANKSFFEPEIKAISAYLENGGRAVISVDLNIKNTGEFAPELLALLEKWYVKAPVALVVDPVSRLIGADGSVAVLASYSKDSPITKDFQQSCAFPFTRPLEVISGAPASLNVSWLAQTTDKAWMLTDLKELAKGAVKFNPKSDKPGPATAAIFLHGKQKDSKANRDTRMVVFGTSYFATNHFARFQGNLDFFLNTVSWVMEDESMISIRAKEESPGKVELSEKSGNAIFLITVLLIPLLTAVGGFVVWMRRRKL